MTNKLWAPGVVVDSPWLNDVNTATYTWLTSIGGTANNITAVGPLAWAAVAGNVFYFLPTATNTAGAALTINSVAGKIIDKYGSTGTVAGDLVAGVVAQVVYDGTNFQLLNPQASIPPAALSSIPVTGRLLNVQAFKTAGTFTYTPTAGTTRVLVKGQGAGGGGGFASATSTGTVTSGGGGGAGGIGETFLTTGFSGASVVIGAGGASTTAGGATSFGSTLLVLNPGAGGTGSNANTAVTASGGAGGTSTGGNILSQMGNTGLTGYATFVSGISSSAPGGQGLYGAAGVNVPTGGGTFAGAAATGNGAGGSGAVGIGSGSAASGGAGAPGIILVYEYS